MLAFFRTRVGKSLFGKNLLQLESPTLSYRWKCSHPVRLQVSLSISTSRRKWSIFYPICPPPTPAGEGGTLCPPCRFFDRSLLTGRALKFILYEFSSNFVLNMGPVTFFDQSNNLPTPACLSVTVNDCRLLWNCWFIATPP